MLVRVFCMVYMRTISFYARCYVITLSQGFMLLKEDLPKYKVDMNAFLMELIYVYYVSLCSNTQDERDAAQQTRGRTICSPTSFGSSRPSRFLKSGVEE